MTRDTRATVDLGLNDPGNAMADLGLGQIFNKFPTNFQLLQTYPKLEEVTHCDVRNVMRHSHFFPTWVSGVVTLTRVDDGRRRSSDGSILGSGDASRYTKCSIEDQWKEQEMLILKENSVITQMLLIHRQSPVWSLTTIAQQLTNGWL